MHAPSTRSAATTRRRRAIGVVAVSLGLVATLQGTDIAAALGAGSDGTDGPVSTDPGASSLLESLSGAGDNIATDRHFMYATSNTLYIEATWAQWQALGRDASSTTHAFSAWPH